MGERNGIILDVMHLLEGVARKIAKVVYTIPFNITRPYNLGLSTPNVKGSSDYIFTY